VTEPGPGPAPGPAPGNTTDQAPDPGPGPGLAALVDPSTLGSQDLAGLGAALRPLLEDAGPLLPRLVGRSWPDWTTVLDDVEVEVGRMDDTERAALLAAHPRIGERPEVLAARSPESFTEQGAGADEDPAVLTRLAQLNEAYETRFGFPFVEWVAGRPKAAIVAVIETRMQHDRTTELAAGTAALVAIARDRLAQRCTAQAVSAEVVSAEVVSAEVVSAESPGGVDPVGPHGRHPG
jgi:2-oxo-4-hydroxy-4-carboxy--5-ureidoimidazoline (OHCU) decarboxylase